MITCDECQRRIAAVFDNEGSENDEKLISTHIENCSNCQGFRAAIVGMRKALISAPVPSVSMELPQECIHEPNNDKNDKVYSDTAHLSPMFRRLVWAGGLAATFIVILSCLSSLMLARKVTHLKGQLRETQYQLALYKAEDRIKDSREREQEAIAILYYKMEELTKEIKDLPSPRRAYLQIDDASDKPGEM